MISKKDINIVVAKGRENLRPLLESLAGNGVPDEARLLYKSRNRVLILRYGDKDYCVKAFRCPSLPNSLIYTHLRDSKARRSFENSLRLIEMGFDAPAPGGYVEVRRNGRLRESYFVNDLVEGETIRDWEKRADAESLLDDFAAYMTRMHRAGVLHRDFSPGNFLVSRDEAGRRHFNVLDVNRMEFGVFGHDDLMRNFRAINLKPEETARLARKYAAAASLDAAETEREALGQLAAYQRSKVWHRFFKRLIGKQKKRK